MYASIPENHVVVRMKKEHTAGLIALLLFAIFNVYQKVLYYPFIQDDWGIIYKLATKGITNFILSAWIPTEGLFYRPVAGVYMAVIHVLFGMDPFWFHFFGLLFHAANSLLVVGIAYKFINRMDFAWITGFFYALSASLHLDPLLWMVGCYDLLGAFFFFASLLFYLRNSIILSVAMFALAVFTKEATLILVGLVVLISLSNNEGKNTLREDFVRVLRQTRYYVGVLLAYGIVRLFAVKPTNGASLDSAYSMKFFGNHILENINRYTHWSLECFFPILDIHPSHWIVLGGAIAFFAFAYFRKSNYTDIVPCLIGWVFVGVLPVIFLEDHAFRYYLTYTIPASILLVIVITEGLASYVNGATRYVKNILITLVIITGGLSFYFVTDLDNRGIDTPTLDGSNNLIRKGRVVSMVERFLQERFPVLPDSTTLVFDWLPTEAFGRSAGLKLWYRNPTISSYEIQQLASDSTGFYLKTSGMGKGMYINPDRILLLTFHGDSLRAFRAPN